MNEYERQERRGRSRFSVPAAMKAALIAGLVAFLLPGGGPWTSNETGLAVMGRIVTPSIVLAAFSQAVLAIGYGFILGMLLYRLRMLTTILSGLAMSLPLYGANYLLFRSLSSRPSNEVHVVLAHIVFCLFFCVLYRAVAVPTVKELEEHGHRPK
jgi:ABC-type antimicrobial peptide transport system permease subunit